MPENSKDASKASEHLKDLEPKRAEAVRGGFFGGLIRKVKGVVKQSIKN